MIDLTWNLPDLSAATGIPIKALRERAEKYGIKYEPIPHILVARNVRKATYKDRYEVK